MQVRKTATTPQALTDELVKAQQTYYATRNSVIARATQRVQSIEEIQKDLDAERDQLREVVAAAK